MAEQEKKEEKKVDEDEEEKKVKVLIQYCPGCGYAAKFNVAKILLEERFPDELEIVANKDSDKTENFEITVDGKLVHSAKTKGHGFLNVDNAVQEEAVCKAIAAAMNKSK